MKNIYKLSAIILLSITMIISSCKKEDEDPVINGCTDTNAMNYLSIANTNDGSCIFAYDIAQGEWNIIPDCEEYEVLGGLYTIQLNDQLPESVDVQGAGNNELYIDIDGTQVTGVIDYEGNIIVASQTVMVDLGFSPISIDVEGNGVINDITNGMMYLTYSFENLQIPNIPLPLPVSGSIDCNIALSR